MSTNPDSAAPTVPTPPSDAGPRETLHPAAIPLANTIRAAFGLGPVDAGPSERETGVCASCLHSEHPANGGPCTHRARQGSKYGVDCFCPEFVPAAPTAEGRVTDCCELEHRSMLLALVRCIVPAIKAGEVTNALRHQVKRLAATYDGEFSVTLATAIIDRPPDPNEPKLIRSEYRPTLKKYLVWPGWVTSSADGQQHYLNAPTLMRLYGVDPDECIIARGYDLSPRRGAENCIDLFPRRDGNYVIPEKRA